MSRLRFINITGTPSAPASGKTEVYVDSANKKLKSIDDAGLVRSFPASGEIVNADVSASAAIETSKLNNHVGSSPPGSPVDGMSWIYNGISGIYWRFIYDSTETTYKWKFVGGPPLSASVVTDQNTTSASYTDLATVGPQVTIPRDGEYLVRFGAWIFPGSGSQGFMSLGGTAGVGDGTDEHSTGTAIPESANSLSIQTLTTAGGGVLKTRYHTNGGSPSANFKHRSLEVIPRRII